MVVNSQSEECAQKVAGARIGRMNFSSPRTLLLVIALILTVLSAIWPIPLWISVLLVEVALLIP